MRRFPSSQVGLPIVALALSSGCGLCSRAPSPSQAPTEEPIAVIDVHTHIAPDQTTAAVDLLRRHRIMMALNCSGGVPGRGFEEQVAAAATTGGRLRPYCSVDLTRMGGPDWAEVVDATLNQCVLLGAVGMKIHKGLGLGLMEGNGALVPVDDPRLDILFERAGARNLPIIIHSGDPQAFFHPSSADNERFAELSAHPSWSFFGARPEGGQWPAWRTVFDQFERRVARHPRTTFVGAHFGNAPEDPDLVGRMLDRYPNYVIETAARVPEIGRQPPDRMRAFFERHQDRILFGTDFQMGDHGLTLGSSGEEPDTIDRVPFFFDATYRYFETDARRMAHPTPIQGNWTIDGIRLPRGVLEKLYWRNAVRVFRLTLPTASGPQS